MKAILIVVDGFGIGGAPDADCYGDVGANTYLHVVQQTNIQLKNLHRLGLGCVTGIGNLQVDPGVQFAKLTEISPGKDTTTGHFEMAGCPLTQPFPTFTQGFPAVIIDAFTAAIKKQVLCNAVASGTEVIRLYGKEHEKTGCPIVYTSADSVFQIACSLDIMTLEQLYDMCNIARKILCGKYQVARVIARPFCKLNGDYVRTSDRRDFSVLPPKPTILNRLQESGFTTDAIGKINDIFSGSGISHRAPVHGNAACLQATLAAIKQNFDGLIFTNLVDTDMLFGHRRDVKGYALALQEIDDFLPRMIQAMHKDDLLMITSDHGCDPTFSGTDHTREQVPLLMYRANGENKNLKTICGFQFVSDTIAQFFSL